MRIRFKLREKLILLTIIAILLSNGITVYLNLQDFIQKYKESITRRVFAHSLVLKRIIDDVIELGIPLGNLEGLEKECQKIVKFIPYAKYCFVMNNEGKIYYHNSPGEMGSIYTDSITQKALKAKTEIVQRYKAKSKEIIYDFSMPLEDITGEQIGLIRIGVLATIIDKEVSRMRNRALGIGTLFIIVAYGLVSLLFNFSILAPIRKLMVGVSKIGKGELDTRIELRTNDEFGELAEAFNKMIEALKQSTVSIGILEKEQKRFHDIADTTKEWIWEVDSQGRYTYSSPAVEKILGYKPEEILGKHFYDFFHRDEREQLRKAAFEVFSQREILQNLLNRNVHKDGHTVILEATGVPLIADDGSLIGYRGVDRDITERKKAEQEREALIKELKESEELLKMQKQNVEISRQAIKNVAEDLRKSKETLEAQKGSLENINKELKEREELLNKQKQEVEDSRRAIKNVAEDLRSSKQVLEKKTKSIEKINKELDDFTYIISHDLKEPLRSIDAFSKFIESDYQDKLDEQGKDYLRRVRANAARMQKLIEDLLEISRIERMKNPFEEMGVEELIGEAKLRLEYRIKEKNAEIIITDKLPRIFCDRVRLTEVFVNLISNALKFCDKPNPRVEIGCSQKDAFYEFYVRDNGPGIEEQYFEKIFEIFQRLGKREEHEGTGAGLTIVKKIIQMHKGKIWVESKIGEGTTFYFTIPTEKEFILGKKKLGEILIEKKLISEEAVQEALKEQGRL